METKIQNEPPARLRRAGGSNKQNLFKDIVYERQVSKLIAFAKNLLSGLAISLLCQAEKYRSGSLSTKKSRRRSGFCILK